MGRARKEETNPMKSRVKRTKRRKRKRSKSLNLLVKESLLKWSTAKCAEFLPSIVCMTRKTHLNARLG